MARYKWEDGRYLIRVPDRTTPINPRAEQLLCDQGAAVLVERGDADFDDGDPENGPGHWGHPDYDHYQSDGQDIVIDWRGMQVSDVEPEPPDWVFSGNPDAGTDD